MCSSVWPSSLRQVTLFYCRVIWGLVKLPLSKALAQALKIHPKKVNSPTFVLMNYYKGKLPLYHFDLYRLENPKAMDTLDFDEYFYGEGISVIEWPERLGRA